jgi:hypothetical protein
LKNKESLIHSFCASDGDLCLRIYGDQVLRMALDWWLQGQVLPLSGVLLRVRLQLALPSPLMLQVTLM